MQVQVEDQQFIPFAQVNQIKVPCVTFAVEENGILEVNARLKAKNGIFVKRLGILLSAAQAERNPKTVLGSLHLLKLLLFNKIFRIMYCTC